MDKMKKCTGEEAKKLYKKGMGWGCYREGATDPKTIPGGWPNFNMPYPEYYYVLDLPEESNDIINKPKHYYVTIDGKDFDCRAVQRALGMYEHHNIATAFAYIWRCLHKENTVKDLEKAVNCLNEEIAYRKSKGTT
jgi:hypothetical protein